MEFTSIDSLQSALRERNYIAERGLATSLYLALKLNRRAEALPQFVEVRSSGLAHQPAGLPCIEQAALAPLTPLKRLP